MPWFPRYRKIKPSMEICKKNRCFNVGLWTFQACVGNPGTEYRLQEVAQSWFIKLTLPNVVTSQPRIKNENGFHATKRHWEATLRSERGEIWPRDPGQEHAPCIGGTWQDDFEDRSASKAKEKTHCISLINRNNTPDEGMNDVIWFLDTFH